MKKPETKAKRIKELHDDLSDIYEQIEELEFWTKRGELMLKKLHLREYKKMNKISEIAKKMTEDEFYEQKLGELGYIWTELQEYGN